MNRFNEIESRLAELDEAQTILLDEEYLLRKELQEVCTHERTKVRGGYWNESKITPFRYETRTCSDCGKQLAMRSEASEMGAWHNYD